MDKNILKSKAYTALLCRAAVTLALLYFAWNIAFENNGSTMPTTASVLISAFFAAAAAGFAAFAYRAFLRDLNNAQKCFMQENENAE